MPVLLHGVLVLRPVSSVRLKMLLYTLVVFISNSRHWCYAFLLFEASPYLSIFIYLHGSAILLLFASRPLDVPTPQRGLCEAQAEY